MDTIYYKPCIDCGSDKSPMFLWVDDETWEAIGCKKDDYLCAHCLVTRIGQIMHYAFIVPNKGVHIIEAAGAKITMEQESSSDKRKRLTSK